MTTESGSTRSTQLTLKLAQPDRRDFEHFVAGPNSGVVNAVKAAAMQGSAIWPLIWGPAQCGKSHLLVAASTLASGHGRRAIYLDAAELISHGPEALEATIGAEIVCLDEIDVLFGDSVWEEGLFHAFNRLRRGGAGLILSAGTAPASFEIALGDLRSRLNWGTTHAIFPLDDAGRRDVITGRARINGIEVSEEVLEFLLSRARRGVGDLARLVDDLAALSFAEKRRITVPLARSLIQNQADCQGS